MSICRGVAGNRGRNPVGIFIHNDAGSGNANANFYRNWLPSHPLENGFAHYYCASDGILQAEDDCNGAWHCAQYNGNMNYLSIEVCQSMGDLEQFKKNEEEALKLAAQKCKQYGIIPNENTIRLHQEVYATSCPHRSVEIHGGASATKSYFIQKIKELMNGNAEFNYNVTSSNSINTASSSANKNTDAIVNFKYRVRTKEDGWLPEVINLNDYAGVRGHAITDIAIGCNKGSLWYQVHIKNGGWLPAVTGYNVKDGNNGYAGNGQTIDAVRVYYNTPQYIINAHGYQQAQYRISPVNRDYYSWQLDNDVTPKMDGYAGAFGIEMDRFQLF